MIAADQPTIFGDKLQVALSSKEDGNQKFGLGDNEVTLKNRRTFLEKAGININRTSLVGITYDTDDFAKYRIASLDDRGIGMLKNDTKRHVDALVVRDKEHALFLPIADCAGVILYDPKNEVLMVSHIGRHSAEQNGAQRSVDYLRETCGSDPTDILIWIGPSVGKATYPLAAFDGKALQDVIVEQLQAAGVVMGHIEASSIDTAHDENYYSHSQFLKGNDEPGRFAIVAQMRGQGEPAI